MSTERRFNAIATPTCPYGAVARNDSGSLSCSTSLFWFPRPQNAIVEARRHGRLGMVVIDAIELELLLASAARLRAIEAPPAAEPEKRK